MTGGKRLRIAALFVIVLVFAFIMDMSSNAITDNTLIRNDTGDGDAVYDLLLTVRLANLRHIHLQHHWILP